MTEFTGEHSNQHHEIVRAIAAGNRIRAANAMRHHLETIVSVLLH